ncbi:DUF29 family protein [Chromatium okenii]|uniref:DUF29 domain-containing protein n=1 Tax=Chromatium okenii TaxID=61644 RepID=A0A2S7XR04_9GAMM|nr:DUF29 family protein [Chromatium okenii]MBV5308196.1 DUF29 family protein [Chromatium okenii]PQJ95831.1 hypothetical protein CXB77_16735 [Chromatium okenii]
MTELSTLYDTDYNAWTLQTAALIRAGRFAELDIEHLLKWEYQHHILSEH